MSAGFTGIMSHGSFVFISFLLIFASSVMAIDLAPLWNFDQPEISEQRFRAALAMASGDDALILQTQIARTYGLRGDFARAREILESIEPQVSAAGAEARVRYTLELGRAYASATHPPASQTPEAKERARSAYLRAFEIAKGAHLDGLAVDALHMLAFVDTAPADQLKWGKEALTVVEASSQPSAKQWEASLRNNLGYALHQLSRYEEALAQFKQAVVLRERGKNEEATRIAHWMVAWTLRSLHREDEALEMQLQLERERDSAGVPSPYVFEELELLYRAKGDEAKATQYAELRNALPK
ncbi:MAG: tetratricopeptide repeat protein [Betaproteobacteria bacterium]